MRCCIRLLTIFYKDHVSYEDVRRRKQAAIGDYDELQPWSRNGNRSGLATSEGILA